MKGDAKTYYNYQLDALDEQRRSYENLVGKNAVTDAWYARQKKELDRELTLSVGVFNQSEYDLYLQLTGAKTAADQMYLAAHSGMLATIHDASIDFFAGVKIGYDRSLEDQMTWVQAGLDIYNQFAASAQSTMSNVLFDAIKGDLTSFGDYWKSFWDSMLRTITDTVAQMAVQWAISKAFELGKGLFLHTGAWDIKEDEFPAILQSGEMVIPKGSADALRSAFGRPSRIGRYG